MPYTPISLFFFFNDTATTEIYTLSLHDALPIWPSMELTAKGSSVPASPRPRLECGGASGAHPERRALPRDRKSTRLNSSHLGISYAVFCLKKKKKKKHQIIHQTTYKRKSVGLT